MTPPGRSLRGTLPSWAEVVLLPVVNIALAFLVVGAIVAIIGVDPLRALGLLVTGALGSWESIGYTLYYATNFTFTGLAVAVAFHLAKRVSPAVEGCTVDQP